MNTETGQLFLPLNQDPLAENPDLSPEARDRLMNQLVRLGDMMGDGLHHEPDGKWIEREYGQVMRALYPGIYRRKRQAKNALIDKNMAALVAKKRCTCGAGLKQKRSGSRRLACTACPKEYKAVRGK